MQPYFQKVLYQSLWILGTALLLSDFFSSQASNECCCLLLRLFTGSMGGEWLSDKTTGPSCCPCDSSGGRKVSSRWMFSMNWSQLLLRLYLLLTSILQCLSPGYLGIFPGWRIWGFFFALRKSGLAAICACSYLLLLCIFYVFLPSLPWSYHMTLRQFMCEPVPLVLYFVSWRIQRAILSPSLDLVFVESQLLGVSRPCKIVLVVSLSQAGSPLWMAAAHVPFFIRRVPCRRWGRSSQPYLVLHRYSCFWNSVVIVTERHR